MDATKLLVPDAFLQLLARNNLPHTLRALPMDASRRCYYRLEDTTRNTPLPLIMECPVSEKPQQFMVISDYLRMMGLRAPKVIDGEGDFFLIEDFGQETYRHYLTKAHHDEEKQYALYNLAVDVLIEIATKATIQPPFLPTYSVDVFLQEAYVFTTWVLGVDDEHHPAVVEYGALWKALLKHIDLTYTFVHRDFHIDNLFYLENDRPLQGRTSLQSCGLIDFQDGLWGPLGYDFVSLINDARVDVPEPLRQHLTKRYVGYFPKNLQEKLLMAFSIMDMHRQLRIVGVFHRLKKRDGKNHYEQYLPRVWGYIQKSIHDPLFYDLKKWLITYGFM